MSKFSTKFLVGTLAVITIMGVFPYAPAAQAQSTSDLQAQIAALLAQITALQAQLNMNTTTPNTSFTRNLTVGSKGADVTALQQILINGGYLKITTATAYFGSLTKAALAAWQSANGISPAVGYFGPISRAAIGGSVVVTPGTPPGPPVVVPGSGLRVSLSSSNPATGSLISSTGSAAARVPVLSVNLTAGSAGGVTVNDLKFTKAGVLSDTSISSAYLVESGKVIGQYSSLSGGVITFTGMNLSVNAGQTRTVTLAIDPATGLLAGNTVSFTIANAADVVAVDNTNATAAISGIFPVSGNIFTVTTVSNPSIASLTISSSSVGTSIYAGTQNVLVSQWTLTGASSPVNLSSLNFKVVGSANKNDIKNVKLFINGTQVGPTLAQVAGDGSAYFDLTSSPAKINTGSGNMQVYADVTGSPSFNFQFELLNTYDVYAIDTQYNVPVSITITGGSGVQITILQGALTVSLASDTPTSNVAKGGSGSALAKFTIYAAGEPVKVKFLTFRLDFTGTTTTLSSMVKNMVMVDDAGNQVGTTINTPPTSNSCDVSGTGTTAGYNTAGTQYTDCFGTSSSNINYIIPANTTRVLTLRSDIQSTAGFSTITANLLASTSNLQGQTSSQLASSGSVTGAALTLAGSSLTASLNSGVGAQTVSKGATNVRIGSYSLTASTAEGVNLNTITILTSASSSNFQNLKLKDGTTQIGITQPTLSNSASYTFSGNINVAAGQTKIIDMYADVLSGTVAATYTAVTSISSCSGSGSMTFTSVTCGAVTGQSLVVAGQATIAVTADNSLAPVGTQIVMGGTGISLAAFRFTENTNIEDVKVTDLNIFDQVASTTTSKSGFTNLGIWNGSTLLATTGAASTSASSSNPGSGYFYQFHFASPLIVPKAGSISLVLKGDVSSYTSSGATDNTTHVFKISTSTDSVNDTVAETVVALGSTSNATSAVTLSSATGNTMTVLRTRARVTAAAIGLTSARSKGTNDDIGTLTFAADSAGAVSLNTIVITFSGTAPSSSSFLANVDLLDQNGNSVMNTSGVASSTSAACSGANTCTKTYNFGNTTAGWTISGGSSYTFKIRVNNSLTGTFAAGTGVSAGLSATINAATDVRYTDGLDSSATSNVSLPSNEIPINVNSVSYVSGT
ncbi:MAG: peptidoglycan-binding protein [Patescibacteria group bacterium]